MNKLFAPTRVSFPDPRSATAEGIVDISDDVRVERLLEAYSFGIFPWPHQDLPTIWCSPNPRGVLDFSEFHMPRSMTKFLNRTNFTWSLNRAFKAVIEACAKLPRPGQSGTWITPRLLRAYNELHLAHYAHSLEVWNGNELVGGLYGVYVGGVFCGESMFYLESNASKFALVQLVNFLRLHGLLWMDIQMVTPVLDGFGGKYISRDEFLTRLELSKKRAQKIDFRT